MTVRYQGKDFVILEKPTGIDTYSFVRSVESEILATFSQAASNASRRTTPQDVPNQLAAVHRLDWGTSGCLVAGATKNARAVLSSYFRDRKVVKRYLAVVNGIVAIERGAIEHPLLAETRTTASGSTYQFVMPHPEGDPASTQFGVLRRMENATLLELFPHTGRMHQLRVHCAAIGYPIVGDDRYGQANRADGASLCLNASSILFEDAAQRPVRVRAKLPRHMAEILEANRV